MEEDDLQDPFPENDLKPTFRTSVAPPSPLLQLFGREGRIEKHEIHPSIQRKVEPELLGGPPRALRIHAMGENAVRSFYAIPPARVRVIQLIRSEPERALWNRLPRLELTVFQGGGDFLEWNREMRALEQRADPFRQLVLDSVEADPVPFPIEGEEEREPDQMVPMEVGEVEIDLSISRSTGSVHQLRAKIPDSTPSVQNEKLII